MASSVVLDLREGGGEQVVAPVARRFRGHRGELLFPRAL